MTDSAIQAIIAAIHSGALSSAEEMCGRLLEQRRDDPDLLFLLALSLQQQGRVRDATNLYEHLTILDRKNPVHWFNYANALASLDRLDEAEDAAREAVRWAPDDGEKLETLGLVQLRLNKPLEARETLLHARALSPESPSINIHAARACAVCRDYRAEELLKPWREWLPLEDSLQYELADAKAESGELMAALELLEDLVLRAPTSWEPQALLASVYERVNRLDDAESVLAGLIDRDSGENAGVSREIAQQKARLAMRRHDAAAARRLLEQCGPRNESDSAFHFSLAKARDALGDTAAVMRSLETAHRLQIEELKLATPQYFEPGAPSLPAAVGRVAHEDYRSWPLLVAPDASQSPVFVVGFPRSGTTLLEQMLDSHPCLQSMDERPFFNILSNQLENYSIHLPEDLGKLDQRDCDELRKGYLVLACSKVPRRWNARLVDKNPLNMLWLPMIHRLFPQAKFILALRHPCDVLLSCYMQNFRAAPLVVASRTLEHLARAYVVAMENWLYHAKLIGPDLFVSRYEVLVTDTAEQTRKIAAFLGLDDAEAMLRFDSRAREKGFIATPSYTQVIEPISTKSMHRWKRYREYFEPVIPILQPMLEHWGYTAD